MRALVFGAAGMLGSALVCHLRGVGVEVYAATRGTDISREEDVEQAFEESRANVAVNCAGIVKSECRDDVLGRERANAVNAQAPHVMADVARRHGARFVHVSTDCVFTGRKGGYREADSTDAEDLYGQTKAAGEISDRSDCLTIRTSFIGRDPRRLRGLLEWLIQCASSTGVVPGYTRALWSGLSAPELSRAITLAIATPDLAGLYHVAGPSVSKADLLEVLVQELNLECRIERVDGDAIDRTLDGSRFVAATGYASPSWERMAKELR